jgi:hypothetical protein
MVSATVLNDSAGVGLVADVVAGVSGGVSGAVSGGVRSWVGAVPSWHRRVVALRAVNEVARMRAPGIARLAVRAALADWGLSEVPCPDPDENPDDRTSLYDTVAGCVSEIVSNAACHVRWDLVAPDRRGIGLTLLRLEDRLRVEVTDPEPVKELPALSGEHVGSGAMTWGRGLWLVGAYVGLWGGAHGIEDLPDGGGKVSWFWLPVGAGPP